MVVKEAFRNAIRNVSESLSEAEQRGVRAARQGGRENVSNMNERSEYRNQNAEAPVNSAFDAPQVPPGIAPAANDEGASAGVISHNAPRQLNPMGKAIAVVLSVLLVLTCWNSYSIEEARRMIIGDDAVPMASTGSGDELLDDVDNGDTSQASNDADVKNDPESQGDEGDADTADEGDASDDALADDTVSEADMQAYLPKDLIDADKVLSKLPEQDPDKKPAEGVQNIATNSEDELKSAFSQRFAFALNTLNASRASDGVYHVGDSSVALVPTFGNQAVLLDGGHLGGAAEGDVVSLTFHAPYLYKNLAGEIKRTNSAEEWKARGGQDDDMRAYLSFPGLPEGWTVYTEHMGQYLKHSAEEAAEGLSGTIVLRYEGVQDEHGITVKETRGQFPAGTALPGAVAMLTDKVPAGEKVDVTAGFTVNSYTAAVDEEGKPLTNEDGSRKANDILYAYDNPEASAVTLSNTEPQLALSAKVKALGEAVMTQNAGFAAYLVTVKAAKGNVEEKGYTLRVTDEPDNSDLSGMLDADGIVAFDATGLSDEELSSIDPSNDATVDVAIAAASDRDGAERQRAKVTRVADGVADVTFTTADGDKLTYDAVSKKAEGERVLYVAVPYRAEALVMAEDGSAHEPVTFDLTLNAAVRGKAVQEEKTADAKALADALEDEDATYIYELPSQTVAFPKAPEPEAPADESQAPGEDDRGDGNGNGNGSQSGDQPSEEPNQADDNGEGDNAGNEGGEEGQGQSSEQELAPAPEPDSFMNSSLNYLMRPLAAFGIETFALAPTTTESYGGTLVNSYFNPSLVVNGASTPLGSDTYLVNSQERPSLSLQVETSGGEGYWGGFSRYGENYYGSIDDAGVYHNPTTNDYQFNSAAEAIKRAEETDKLSPRYNASLIQGYENAGNTTLAQKAKLEDYNRQKDEAGYWEMGTRLYLNVPYLYRDTASGATLSTYEYSTWKQLGGAYNADGEPTDPTNFQFFGVSLSALSNITNYWYIYLVFLDSRGEEQKVRIDGFLGAGGGKDTNKIPYIDQYPELKDLNFTKGVTGRIMFEWHGTTNQDNPTGFDMKMYKQGLNGRIPNGTVNMVGDLDENAGGTIYYGGDAAMWTESVRGREKHWYPTGGMGGKLVATMGESVGGKSRKVTLLKTNLNWDTTYEAISDNVLFDRYNYMAYKVDTQNTSTGDSEIDYLEYFLTVHNTRDNNNHGITDTDLMQWKYLCQTNAETGQPIAGTGRIEKNNFITGGDPVTGSQSSFYIGKPNEGGVLIYDTTDWLPQDYEALDMREFKNIDSINTRAKSRPKSYVENKDDKGVVVGKKIVYDESHDADYPIMDGTVDRDGKPFAYPAKLIPYRTNNMNGMVNFIVYPDEGGHLYPTGRIKNEVDNSHFSFIIAVPLYHQPRDHLRRPGQ